MPHATEISLEKAKQHKLFYFVATVVIVRKDDGRSLILKRHEREVTHPGKWGLAGGKMEWSSLDLKNPTRFNGDVLDFDNAVEALCRREAREEAGVELAGEFRYLRSIAFVRPDGVPVVCVKMAAAYAGGEVTPEPGSFTDAAWVSGEEIASYDCIETVADEVRAGIAAFRGGERTQVAVAVAAVVRDGTILISKRRDTAIPDADGRWELPAGKIGYGEDPARAAEREALEETGVTVRAVQLLPKLEHTTWKRKDGGEMHVILLGYRCEVASGEPQVGLDPKVSELKFVSRSDLSSHEFLPGDREIAEAALSAVS